MYTYLTVHLCIGFIWFLLIARVCLRDCSLAESVELHGVLKTTLTAVGILLFCTTLWFVSLWRYISEGQLRELL
jgi:hypothetical protein